MNKVVQKNSAPDWLPRFFGQFELRDIVTSAQHSIDFSNTRADYNSRRLRFMLLVFAVAICLWIPVDYFTLSREHFDLVVIARVVLSAALLLFWIVSFLGKRPWLVYSLLSLSLIAVMGFYLVSMLIMASGAAEAPQEGYRVMPFLMVALLGLFPLTLVMGVVNIVLISGFFLTLAGLQQGLGSAETLNQLWVLVLISGCTLWIQSGQLLMLLKLYRESTRDPLTGLINRRVLMKRLDIELEQFQEQQRPFTIMMFDLDRFKRINDQYGHLTGDRVLKQAASILSDNVRRSDIVSRYGGEEFMAVLSGMTLEQSLPLAEQIRLLVAQQSMRSEQGDQIRVTTSIGLTEYRGGEELSAMIERADSLLYLAKDRGRNQVVTPQCAPPVADLFDDQKNVSAEAVV